jgi:hypothetical protein
MPPSTIVAIATRITWVRGKEESGKSDKEIAALRTSGVPQACASGLESSNAREA